MQDIYNYLRISDKIVTSGQPTEAQLRAAAEEGVQVVINLATLGSDTTLEDEAGLVQALGMQYFHIPVVWDNPMAEDFTKFSGVMQKAAGKYILIHCVANYRVTAFFSLYAMSVLGWSEVRADELMASIWRDGPYPIWDAFIKCMRSRIQNPSQ
jgi:protein tyrosine phosphatase (PTP) superfamily phosphohydrolase (DUF442 family)